MTDHRIKNNPLSSFENKQRNFSNISYMVLFTYYTIYGVIITGFRGVATQNEVYSNLFKNLVEDHEVTLPHLAEVSLRQGVQNPAFLQFPDTKNDPTETQFS